MGSNMFDEVWIHWCKRCWGDDLYSLHYECTKILSDTMTPNLQKPAEEGYSSIIMIQGTLPTSQ